MSLLYPSGQTPYLGRAELLSAPTGITWATLPPGSQVTEQQRIAEQLNILGRATARVDGTEPGPPRHHRHRADSRPDFRVTIQVGAGNGRVTPPAGRS